MQNYKQNQEHILHTIKTQKRVEPKVDESILETTRYAKQRYLPGNVGHTVNVAYYGDVM